MAALVIVLVVTNVATAATLIVAWRRRSPAPQRHAEVASVLAATPRPTGPINSAGRTRRVIAVEILNPLELAGGRGRMFGIAGSLVPDLTRRLVYDQTVRQLREQLAHHRVVADVRVHVVPGAATPAAALTPVPPAAPVPEPLMPPAEPS